MLQALASLAAPVQQLAACLQGPYDANNGLALFNILMVVFLYCTRYAANCVATGGVEGGQGVAGLLDCTWTDTLDLNADSLLGSDIVQVGTYFGGCSGVALCGVAAILGMSIESPLARHGGPAFLEETEPTRCCRVPATQIVAAAVACTLDGQQHRKVSCNIRSKMNGTVAERDAAAVLPPLPTHQKYHHLGCCPPWQVSRSAQAVSCFQATSRQVFTYLKFSKFQTTHVCWCRPSSKHAAAILRMPGGSSAQWQTCRPSCTTGT